MGISLRALPVGVTSETRNIENYNLIMTLKSNPILGSGWGHEYEEVSVAYSIKEFFEQYRYIPHNSLVGLVAFTTETHPGEGVVLGEGLRYAHAAAHVRAAVAGAGLKLAFLEEASPRDESNIPVPGLVVVAAKT